MSDKDILKSKVSQIAWSIIKYLSCILAAFIFILPIVTIFLASFKGYEEFYSSGKLSLPENMFNFSNYVTAFIDGWMLRGFMNTAFIMVISLAVTILL